MSAAANPWMKFYPQDWRADERLRNCSLAARGLWMEMLAIMHRSERYGHLLIAGMAPTDAQLAIQAGASPDEVYELIVQLESAGVFSRSAGGAIYSRRMTRDQKKAETARKYGKRGGNPSLCNTDDNLASDNHRDKGEDNRLVKPSRTHKPEARGQKEKTEPRGSSKSIEVSLPDDWEPEPFKSGKCKAIVESWSTERLETEAAKFKAHHRKRGNKWVNWQAAWETWVLNSVGFDQPRPNGSGHHQPRDFVDIVLEEAAQRERASAGKPP